MKKYFFMVYLEGCNTPTFKHECIESAEIEAKRLSKAYKKKAYVLCTLKSFEIVEFQTEDLRPETDLPF